MDSGQGAGSWAGLLGSGETSGFAHDTALSDQKDVAVREFLFELTDETISLETKIRKDRKNKTKINDLGLGSMYDFGNQMMIL